MVTEKQKANLIRLSPSEAREQGRKGGKASAKARAAKVPFKQMAQAISQEDREKVLKAMLKAAEDGSLPHAEMILKLLGEHPSQDTTTADKSISISISGGDDSYAD